MYEASLFFLKKIDSLGYEGYIIGGFPRDRYLGINTNDIDICTNMKPDELKKNFVVIESFDKYGSVRVKYKNYIFEVTTFRKDGEYVDFRRPTSVEFIDSLEEDLKRRDFTINTLCINKAGEYVDLIGARKDIDNKIIKVIGNVEKKLKEDPIRIIRALRFSSKLNFKIDENLQKGIIKYKNLIEKIPKNSLNKELDNINDEISKENFKKLLLEYNIFLII